MQLESVPDSNPTRRLTRLREPTYRATTRRQFTFDHKSLEISGTHLIDLRRMKGWLDPGTLDLGCLDKKFSTTLTTRSFDLELLKWDTTLLLMIPVMLCAIWYHLHNLKIKKNTHGEKLLLKVTLLHECFLYLFNCTNGTKLRKASQLFILPWNEVLIFSQYHNKHTNASMEPSIDFLISDSTKFI